MLTEPYKNASAPVDSFAKLQEPHKTERSIDGWEETFEGVQEV